MKYNSHIDASNSTFKEFEVKKVDIYSIKQLIKDWHYTNNIQGVQGKYCFGLYWNDELIGACMYGQLSNPKVAYNKKTTIELRRLALINNTPKNTASWFVSKTLKWLEKNTDLETVISYSDLKQGHEGTVYKALNFSFTGKTAPSKGIRYHYQRKIYHQRCLYNTSGNQGIRLRASLDKGDAKWVKLPGKNRYKYQLKRNKRSSKRKY